eukprot:TRINITY_DN14539_c0_g1_i1.p1 TRINITY_DN14539_c0_g1~~TRINITY_DN14539_c0_g1_i1.p1  ORF type:complete len:743 (-),score=176.31 TRINITY_DN14539_c0_g1_i1:856-3084(-)
MAPSNGYRTKAAPVAMDLDQPVMPSEAAKDESKQILSRVCDSRYWFEKGHQTIQALVQEGLRLAASHPDYVHQILQKLVAFLAVGSSKEANLAVGSIGGRAFKTRQELSKACHALLHQSTEGERLERADAEFLKALLEFHPRASEKAAGLLGFTTGSLETSARGKAKCFVLIRENGQEDFSYLRCVDNVPTNEIAALECICDLLVSILRLHPNASEGAARLLSERLPYIQGKNVQVEKHRNWVHSVLRIAESCSALSEFLLVLLTRRMVEIDVDICKIEERLEGDEDACATGTNGPVDFDLMAQILDVMMLRTFGFLQRRLDLSDDGKQANGKANGSASVIAEQNSLVQTMLSIFDGHVLLTYRSKHVQFLFFYICSLRPHWTESFLTRLLQTAYSPGKPLHERLISMRYLASFVARAKFLTGKYSLRTTQYLAAFARENLQVAEKLAADGDTTSAQFVLFLAAVETVCYIICWHIEDFAAEKLESGQSGLAALLGTDAAAPEAFSPVLESPCRPFSRIAPAIGKQFLRVIRSHFPPLVAMLQNQMPRRGAVVTLPSVNADPRRRMSSNIEMADDATALDVFFPFDPYRLRHSGIFVKDIYQSYEDIAGSDGEDDSDAESSEGAADGFQKDVLHADSMANPRARLRSGSSVCDGEDSSDVDFVESQQPAERGFIASVGPSPAFRPQKADMIDISPLLVPMEEGEDYDNFLLPQPAQPLGKSTGNPVLDRMMSTPAYQVPGSR